VVLSGSFNSNSVIAFLYIIMKDMFRVSSLLCIFEVHLLSSKIV